jgi:hypothetical protein
MKDEHIPNGDRTTPISRRYPSGDDKTRLPRKLPHENPFAGGPSSYRWPDPKPVKSETKGYDMISFEVDVVSLADFIAKTVIKKQKDYGPNNIRRSPYGAQQGLVVRLYDKIARLANLTRLGKTPENESLRDTYIDIAGYAIIGLMILDGTFPKEQ